MMHNETRIAIVEHAARWASNALSEVLCNHGGYIDANMRDRICDAIQSLVAAQSIYTPPPITEERDGK